MGVGSKKGSGYGGMKHAVCPECGGNFKRSSWQIFTGRFVCTNRAKCEDRKRRRDERMAKRQATKKQRELIALLETAATSGVEEFEAYKRARKWVWEGLVDREFAMFVRGRYYLVEAWNSIPREDRDRLLDDPKARTTPEGERRTSR